jgi:DNA-binding NarL/FixJ family response regulator
MVRVFLVDDHETVRDGLRELLEAHGDLEVVGEAGTAEEARSQIPTSRPNVAVLDVRLPDGTGVEVCRGIRSQYPDIHCLMLTAFADDDVLLVSAAAGASGYVLKRIEGGDIVDSVRLAAASEMLFDAEIRARAARHRDGAPSPELS